jgi:uncharacterized protein YdeI (BOF family)
MRLLVIASIACLTSVSAFAQMSAPAQQGPQNPAVNTSGTNSSDAPVKGANSFTHGEAASRIAARGYTHVKGLHKDSAGVWRATAMKDGQTVPVSLDFEGNVNSN